jgi:hypothetical protein
MLKTRIIKRIDVVLWYWWCPKGQGKIADLLSFSLIITKKSSVLSIVKMLCYVFKIISFKLKLSRVLLDNLPYTIKKLNEYWTPLIIKIFSIKVSKPFFEHVSKWKPVFFNKNLKTFNCSKIRVKHQLN